MNLLKNVDYLIWCCNLAARHRKSFAQDVGFSECFDKALIGDGGLNGKFAVDIDNGKTHTQRTDWQKTEQKKIVLLTPLRSTQYSLSLKKKYKIKMKKKYLKTKKTTFLLQQRSNILLDIQINIMTTHLIKIGLRDEGCREILVGGILIWERPQITQIYQRLACNELYSQIHARSLAQILRLQRYFYALFQLRDYNQTV